MDSSMDRRSFLKVGTMAGVGFLLNLYLPTKAEASENAMEFPADIWLKITEDDQVFITVARSEMGQGVHTSVPMVIAEELSADWSKVRVEQASADPRYKDQTTGGSQSIRVFWDDLRRMGATAREMLRTAAAQTWKIKRTTCRAENGFIVDTSSGRKLSYGKLAAAAVKVPIPEEVAFKKREEYNIIGKDIPRIDIPAKVDGSAQFGIDVRVPGMLYATLERCPVIGGKLKDFDASRAKKVAGVRDVFAIPRGVAVVADSYWAALKGRHELEITWDEGKFADLSSAKISQIYRKHAKTKGHVAQNTGDANKVLSTATEKIEAEFEMAFLAHATLEPMNCTAHVRDDSCEVWAPTQSTNRTRDVAAKVTGLPPEAVTVHTTLLGGGFGRRLFQDYVEEAVHISKKIKKPVKLLWTREDDTRHDFYRPGTYHSLQAVVQGGKLVAWWHRCVGPSTLHYWAPEAVRNGFDISTVFGATEQPYDIPNFYVDTVNVTEEVPIPVGWWRAVGFGRNAFVNECFIDRIAAKMGKDPYQLRRELLHKSPRFLKLLDMVAEKAEWNKPLPKGVGRGIAIHGCFGGFAAEVAEVSVKTDGTVEVHRIVGVMDCGTCVNPDIVRAQVEGGVVDSLGAMFKCAVTFDKGRAVEGNFHDYQLLRIDEVPKIEAYVLPSTEKPGGVGEVSVPPLAPAVANAIFNATGKFISKLPIDPTELRGEEYEEAW